MRSRICCKLMAWRRVFAILLLLIAFPATLCLGDEAEETASEADSSENEVVAEETVDESAKVDDEVKEEDDGLVLATKTFDSVVNDKDVTLVESNAPWFVELFYMFISIAVCLLILHFSVNKNKDKKTLNN